MQFAIPFWQYGDGSGGGLSVIASDYVTAGYRTWAPPDPLLTVWSGDGGLGPVTITAIASGGTPPYTYAWARTGGDVEITAHTPTAATTKFKRLETGTWSYNTLFQCTVTDAALATASTSDVDVTLEQNT